MVAEGHEENRRVRLIDRSISVAEDGLYAVVAAVLVLGAAVMLGATAWYLVTEASNGVQDAVTGALDKLLLVFILIELLSAVRTTVMERKLVAEPFLIVGIIATIKEIVVIAVDAKEDFGKGDVFDDAMLAIGIAAGLLVALGVTAYLTRRKERE